MKKTMVDYNPAVNLAALISQSTLDRVRKELLEARSPESLRCGVRGIFQSPQLPGSGNNLPLVTESVIQMAEPGGIIDLQNNEPPVTESITEPAKPKVTVADNVSMSDLSKARASLYTEHEVRDKFMLGPAVWHRPNITFHKDQLEKAQPLCSYTSPALLQHQTHNNTQSTSDATVMLNTILAQEQPSPENISSVEKSAEAVCVKTEPIENSVISDLSVTVAGLSTNHEVKDEPWLIEKDEECKDNDLSSVNMAHADLYTDYLVKDKLELDSEVWYRPTVSAISDQVEKAPPPCSYTSAAPLQHQIHNNTLSTSDATLMLNTILAKEQPSPEKERHIPSVEKSAEAVCVKTEPDENSVVSDLSVTVAGPSTDREVKDEPWLIEKDEECKDSDLSSVNMAQAGPTVSAIGDQVKPAQSVSVRTREQLVMASSVQPERLRHDLQQTRICSGEKTYSCEECGQSFKRKSAVRKHINQHLSSKIAINRKEFSCDFCISTFKSNLLMLEHQKEHAGSKPASATKKNLECQTIKKRHNCSYCSYSSPYQDAVRCHERRHTGEKPIQCGFCDFKTSHRFSMKTHLMTHTNDRPFQCSICNLKCSTRTYLRTHMDVHTGKKRFQCDQCDYKTNRNNHLQSHLKIHAGEKPFQCNSCDYKCRTKRALRDHQKRHSGEFPFKCTKCSYKCIYKARLQQHQVIHTDEKPYECSHCHKRFALKCRLQYHLFIHTGEKPFECSDCDYKCNRKEVLKQHQRIHRGEKPFECSDCDYKCNRKAQLRQHETIHTGEKRFQCNHCTYASRRKQYLQSHLQTKHK